MDLRTICRRRGIEVFVVWLMLPLVMFGLAFLIKPWVLLICSLGNPLFEPLVDGFQVIIRSDSVSRVFFGLVFIYCHMLLPTALYYLSRNRRLSLVLLSVWTVFVSSTVLNLAGLFTGKS
jgi:hypothetical protein